MDIEAISTNKQHKTNTPKDDVILYLFDPTAYSDSKVRADTLLHFLICAFLHALI